MAEPLARLERWMQAVITHERGPAAGAASADAAQVLRASIEEVLLPSAERSAEERVDVYASMYFARLIEVLEEEFPALTALLGHESAHACFRAYVVAHPSRHYSLNALGARLPDFLQDGGFALESRVFAAELARLERTIQEVFDARDVRPLDAAAIAAVPAHAWEHARLVPVPAFALLAFEHPVNAWYQAFRDERALPDRAPGSSWVAVHRHEDRVWRTDLSRAQHALLAALRDGRTLAEALGALAEVPDVRLEELGPEIQRWFRNWAADGFFERIER